MSPERLRLIREIFGQASELPEDERGVFLDGACGEDRDLFGTVSALLTESESGDSPFDDLVNKMIWPTLESLGRSPGRIEDWLDSDPETGSDEKGLLVGRTISRFEILGPIGRGGMGMVYRAHDRTLDRFVALKFLPLSLSSDQEAKDRFVHEAKAASALSHPNIATIHEIGETEDHQMFIAMGYYPGKTLKEKIEAGPIAVDEATSIATQLVTGLKEAHERGVIHRDIKPGNIIVSEEGAVVLLDFGLAKLSSETGYTQIGQMAGTIAYMAPEQVKGEPIDERTDIWSFGVVVYEMLTGQRPFVSDNAQLIIRSIMDEDPVSPSVAIPGLPRSFDAVLGLCLAKNPNHRYQNTGELLDDLQRIREGGDLKRYGGRATWKGRPRLRLVRLGAGVVAVVSAVALLLQYWPKQNRTGDRLEGRTEIGTGDFAASSPGDPDTGMGGDDQTIEILKQLWRQNPNSGAASRVLGTYYDYSLNQYDEAMLWYRRAYALESENVALPNRIGDLYEILRDRDASIWWTERALHLAPESDLSNSIQVKVNLLRGEVIEALEFFRGHPTGRAASASALTGDPLVRALPYYGSGTGPEQPEGAASLGLLLEALIELSQMERALEFCETYFLPLLDPPGADPGRATLRVIPDPFDSDHNHVLEFDPGFLREEVLDWFPSQVITRWEPRHRSVAIRLPPAARVAISETGTGRSTLYLRVGRSVFDHKLADMDLAWGLASSDGFSDYAVASYADLSVQSRFRSGGSLELRDGKDFVEFTSTPPEDGVFHELWYVIDHDQNTFDLYIRGGRQFPEQTAISRGAHFRKETREILDLLVLIQNIGQDRSDSRRRLPGYIDDIYVDPKGANLGTPDAGWVRVDDFEDGDVADWMTRLSRSDHLLEISHVGIALDVVRTLRMAAREEAAIGLLDIIEASVESTWLPELNRNVELLSRIHALRGERDKVLEDLRTLFSSGQTGWYWDGLLRKEELEGFLDLPEIREVVSELDESRNAQLARIRELERRNELAPVPTLPEDFRSLSTVSFARVMSGPVLADNAQFTGQGWGDFDGDGFVDIVLAEEERGMVHLYRNGGDGTFSRVTDSIPAEDLTFPNQPSWADQDNDGDLDLFIATKGDEVDAFYRNEGQGRFTRVREGAWVETPTSSDNVAWGDFDNDGSVDLYVTSDRERNFLYHNDGDGTMTPVESEANRSTGYSNGLAWSDFDGDGDVDLFVGGQDEVQFRNDGNGVFKWVSPGEGGVPALLHELGVSSADYDNDGDLDLLYSTWKSGTSIHLFRNDGASGYYDEVRAVPSVTSTAGNGSAWGDFDNDGWLDFYIANGSGPNLLYHNEGGDRFTLVVDTPPVDDNLSSLRCAWVDFDNDGDLDLSVTNEMVAGSGRSFQLFRNEGRTHHWIMVRLVGTVSNRTAFGAKVRVQAVIGGEKLTQLRQIGGNGDTPGELRAHFGLGDATVIESLRVEWPSGIVQEVHDIGVDRFLSIEEPASGRDQAPGETAGPSFD